jgi:hypothetical protein
MNGYQFSCFCLQFSQFFLVPGIPKVYLSTSTANDPIAGILFFAIYSVSKTNLNLKYSFFNFSFSFLSSMLRLSSFPKYLFFSQVQFFEVLLKCASNVRFLWILPFFKLIFAHFSNPKSILMSLLTAFTIFISFSKSSSSIYSSKSSTSSDVYSLFLPLSSSSSSCYYIIIVTDNNEIINIKS